MLPPDYVAAALEHHCQGVAWTYNDPSIWLTYTLECARLAKEAGLYTVYVTNGYATREHLDTIAPYLDVYRVDIKSLDDAFYGALIRTHQKDLLGVTRRAQEQWGLHVECVTNAVPGWNDSDDNLRRTAAWIATNLGELTPWHITRFFPHAEMMDTPPTPLPTLRRGRQIGYEEGLRFVYLGNVQGEDNDTRCPGCGTALVRRAGYWTRVVGAVADRRCLRCGSAVNLIV